MEGYRRVLAMLAVFALTFRMFAQNGKSYESSPPEGQSQGYVLGPEDMVFIQVANVDELQNQDHSFRVDLNGYVNVPRIGRIYATGLAADQLEAVLADRFRTYLQNPVVSVRVAEFHSKPITVVGAVVTPGVHSLQGNKTLLQVISEAGGLSSSAGTTIKITRRQDEGPIPLATTAPDTSGEFSVAQVNIHDIIDSTNPKNNILVRPYDVISVQPAESIYVIGAVIHAGGFSVSDHQSLSVLEALSLANGLDKVAEPKNAKVLRFQPGSSTRTQIPVNVKKILAGKDSDFPLMANDILFIPNNSTKNASLKVLQAAVTLGTGIAVYSVRF